MAKAVRPTGDAPKKNSLTADEIEQLRAILRAVLAHTAAMAETGPPLDDPCKCKLPACPESGTVVLKCVDGLIQWVV